MRVGRTCTASCRTGSHEPDRREAPRATLDSYSDHATVAVITEAGLSFLGLGVPPPTPDWGQMIAEAEPFYQQAGWFLVFPGAALVITTLCIQYFWGQRA
jgi:ABC-type antimicrobial peptide transport system permease subunit